MCGRFSLIGDLSLLAHRFQFDGEWPEFDPRYNIAPTDPVLTLRGVERRQAALMRWGLVPSWAKDPKVGAQMINARAETVAEKPAFRSALRSRRCLVLADSYYEWQRSPSGRRPFRIVLRSGEPFAFAGLWEAWRDPRGNVLLSCAVVTTPANELLAPIHDRMPAILPRELEELWLDAEVEDAAGLAGGPPALSRRRPGGLRGLDAGQLRSQ